MMNRAIFGMMVLGASLGAFAMNGVDPLFAQNALGGPTKPKQNSIGGAAKPAPVIGGATHNPVVTKPVTIGNVTKPGSIGTPTPGAGGTTPGLTANAMLPGTSTARQNPPVTPPNKGKTVVSTTSNLKCGGGACVTRGAKP